MFSVNTAFFKRILFPNVVVGQQSYVPNQLDNKLYRNSLPSIFRVKLSKHIKGDFIFLINVYSNSLCSSMAMNDTDLVQFA